MRKIYIVGCGAEKLPTPAPAAELYTGPLFKAALTYARSHAFDDNDIRIMSALHGLVELVQEIAPYDKRITDPDAITASQLQAQFDEKWLRARVQFVFLCPNDYATRLLDAWRAAKREHAEFECPLRGLGIGLQRSWLLQNTKPTTNPIFPFIPPF